MVNTPWWPAGSEKTAAIWRVKKRWAIPKREMFLFVIRKPWLSNYLAKMVPWVCDCGIFYCCVDSGSMNYIIENKGDVKSNEMNIRENPSASTGSTQGHHHITPENQTIQRGHV